MDVRVLNATLETRKSSKTGKMFKCVIIKLTPNYEKLVFLDSAELALLDSSNATADDFNF